MAQVQEGQQSFKTFEISHNFPLLYYNYQRSPYFNLSCCGKIEKVAIELTYQEYNRYSDPFQVKCVKENEETIKSKLLEASVNSKLPRQNNFDFVDIHEVGSIAPMKDDIFTVKVKIYFPIESHKSEAVEAIPQIGYEKELNKLMVQQMNLADSTKVNITCAGESFEVNKLLLKARSPVFKRILDNPKSKEAEKNKINFDNYGKDITKIFCNFLNSFELPESMLTVYALDLFCLGKMYEIKPLSDVCIEPICEKIDVNSFVEIASLAHLHKNDKILSAAKKFFLSDTEAIKNLQEWKEATKSQPNLGLSLLEAKGNFN